MKITEPYSPTARAKASAKPVSSSAAAIGRMTLRDGLPAARAKRRGCFLDLGIEVVSTGCTVRTTNGSPMKTSAMSMPSGV